MNTKKEEELFLYRRHMRKRSHTHGATEIIRKDEKCGTAASKQAIIVDAVGDAAHAVLPDPKSDVTTGWIGGSKVAARGNVVESASMKIGASTHTVDNGSRNWLENVLAGFASRNFGVCRKNGNLGE